MALIKCPECANNVSDTAQMCPQCGFNINMYVKKNKINDEYEEKVNALESMEIEVPEIYKAFENIPKKELIQNEMYLKAQDEKKTKGVVSIVLLVLFVVIFLIGISNRDSVVIFFSLLVFVFTMIYIFMPTLSQKKKEKILNEINSKNQEILENYTIYCNSLKNDAKEKYVKARQQKLDELQEGKHSGIKISADKVYTPKCPTCQSPDIKKITNFEKAEAWFWFGFLSRKVRKQWHCNNCGSEW